MKAPAFISSLMQKAGNRILLDQMVSSAGSFLTTIILARQLGIDSFGVYSSIVLFLYLLLSISNALIIAPFQVLQAKHTKLQPYISALLFWQILTCILFIITSALVALVNIEGLAAIQANLTLVCFLLAGFLLQDFCRRVLLAINKAKQTFYIDCLTNVIQIAWLALSMFQHRLDLHQGFLIMSITYVPSVALGIYFIKPVMPAMSELKSALTTHLHTGKWLLLTAVLQWWAGNLFVVASGIFLGLQALGALRLAQTLFGVLNAFLQVYENHVLPTAARLYSQSTDHLKHYLWATTRKSFLLLLPVSIALIVFARPIFLFVGGSEYVEHAYALQGMALLYLLIFTGYPLRAAIRVMLLNREFFTGYIFSFLFSLMAARFFIEHWGITGVISGLIINQLCMQLYWQYVLMRKNFILWN